jgi:hypothetical protein
MREKGKGRVSSFEPRRLKEALKELEDLERQMLRRSRALHGETELPSPPSVRPPGVLLRWWRLLFGMRE